MSMVDGLVRGRVLTVTGLGRSLRGGCAPKHQIKKADRLVGNPHLHSERSAFYEAMYRLIIGPLKRPVVLIDWSDVGDGVRFQKLRASVAIQGRALTLYKEVHAKSKSANPRVQLRFLNTLQRMLPESCRPIVVTDAGFKNPWFKAVSALGWDFLGRVGGHIMIRKADSEQDWMRVEQVFAMATGSARYHGRVELARSNALECYAYTLKRTPAAHKAHKGIKRSEPLK